MSTCQTTPPRRRPPAHVSRRSVTGPARPPDHKKALGRWAGPSPCAAGAQGPGAACTASDRPGDRSTRETGRGARAARAAPDGGTRGGTGRRARDGGSRFGCRWSAENPAGWAMVPVVGREVRWRRRKRIWRARGWWSSSISAIYSTISPRLGPDAE